MNEHAGAAGALDGRVAVVLGSTGWIGRAICHELARAGASLVVVGRDADRLDALQRELDGGDRVLSALADVTSQLEVDDVREAATARFGHVDLLVVSSGVITGSAFGDGVPADWAQMIDVNLRGLLHACQTFSEPLVQVGERGAPADVVLIGAVGSEVRAPRFAVFNAVSSATKQLARALRLEHGPRGVRVHVVEPTFAVDGAVDGANDDAREHPGEHRAAWEPARSPQQAHAGATVAPEAIAAVVALAAALPPGVNLAEVLLLPTGSS